MRQLAPVTTLILLHSLPASAQANCERWGAWDSYDPPTVEQLKVCLEAGEDVNAVNGDGSRIAEVREDGWYAEQYAWWEDALARGSALDVLERHRERYCGQGASW